MSDLTPEEMKFFETGDSTELKLPDAPADAPAVDAPKVEPAAPVVEAPPIDMNALLADERQRREQVERQMADLQKQLQEKTNPPVQAPDENEDPLGAMMHELRKVNAVVAELETKLTQEQQNNLLKQQFDQFTASVRQVKDAFEKTTPDFSDAYTHVRAVRTEDLRMLGVAEADIQKVLLNDEINIAQAAVSKGKNPAEEMYKMAKRYGFVSKGAAAQNPAQKIATLVAGQQAAKQPAKASPESDLTLDGLKDAGEDDLNKIIADDKMWAKLVGGHSDDIF